MRSGEKHARRQKMSTKNQKVTNESPELRDVRGNLIEVGSFILYTTSSIDLMRPAIVETIKRASTPGWQGDRLGLFKMEQYYSSPGVKSWRRRRVNIWVYRNRDSNPNVFVVEGPNSFVPSEDRLKGFYL